MGKRICYVVFFLVLILVTQVVPAHADSGWDSSYDSGGSSSSSWDSGSSSSEEYSSSLGMFGLMLEMGAIVVSLVIIVICILIDSKRKRVPVNVQQSIVPSYDVEEIKQVLPDFDKNVFRMLTFDIYKRIQVAWMDFDYEALRQYTKDELYNLYHSQLIALQVKKQRNIMRDFKLKSFEIVGMERVENTIALKVRMMVECFDYVVDKEGKVVRGTDRQKMVYDYEMTFIKGMDTKVNKCPNCNAPQENTNSSVCPYCDSVIVSSNYDWVLAKKQMINQYRK